MMKLKSFLMMRTLLSIQHVQVGDQLLDALGNLYELSETLTVCIYCGSTEHDHLQCENPNNKEIKKVLKNMRAVLTEKGDEEMEQEEEQTEKKEDAPEEEVPKEQRQTTRTVSNGRIPLV